MGAQTKEMVIGHVPSVPQEVDDHPAKKRWQAGLHPTLLPKKRMIETR